MSTGHHDDDDEAEAIKPFWQLSREWEEARGNEADDEETEDNEQDTDADETTDSAVVGADTTDDGERIDGSQPKRQRKDRRPNMLGTVRQEFTEVSTSGVPLAPIELVRGYGSQLGCIVRNTVSINTENLRHQDRGHMRHLLFQKLHARYKFPDAYENTNLQGNKVNQQALTKMSTALSSWKSRVTKRIEKGQSFEEINVTEPMISEEDYREFKAKCDAETTKLKSAWGKKMRGLNIGNHNLGSGGYRGKQPIWDKEDANLLAKGLENPFNKFDDKQVRNFVRARYRQDPETKEFTVDPKAAEKLKLFESFLESGSASAGSQSSSSQGSTPVAPWDNTFNRAINLTKGKPKSSKPSSGGRVVGLGCSTKWGEHYDEDPKTRNGRRIKESRELKELREEVDKIRQIVQEQVANQVAKAITSLLPSLIEGLGNWNAGGRQGPPPIPSIVSNNSNAPLDVLVTPPANIVAPDVFVTAPGRRENMLVAGTAPELNAPSRRENTPADGTAPASNPSTSTPAVGGPSTLPELDAIKVLLSIGGSTDDTPSRRRKLGG